MTFQDYALYLFAGLSTLLVIYFVISQIILPVFRGESIIPIADYVPQVRQEIADRVEASFAEEQPKAKARSSTKTTTKAKVNAATRPKVAKKAPTPKVQTAPKKTAAKPKPKTARSTK